MNYHKRNLLSIAVSTALLATTSISSAEEDVTQLDNYVIEDVSDDFSILPSEPTEGSFGFSKTLVETPRSVSEVSSDLVKNYGLRSVDDLVKLTPGAFTSSFFGIQGAMDLRGEPADNFFRGFRRINNPGAYKTNIRGASTLEIMRGPVSALYGTGSVGGQLNYIPKSAKSDTTKYIPNAVGEIEVTTGSYDQTIVSAEGGAPFTLFGRQGGIYAFAEYEESGSFYDDYDPRGKMVQLTVDYDLTDNTTMEVGFQWQKSDHIQVPGWNRVTQELIDHGTYITGTPAVTLAGADELMQPGNSGFVSPFAGVGINGSFSSVNSWCVPSAGVPFTTPFTYNGNAVDCFGPTGDYALTNVGTAQLDHETIFIDDDDYADSQVFTLYADFITELSNGMVWKNQFFHDYMDHEKFQSWGFTAYYPNSSVYEFRSSLQFEMAFNDGAITTDNIVGVNFRKEDLQENHAWFDETFDRRDLTIGPTPEDAFAPADVDAPLDGSGSVRNFNIRNASESINTGIFMLSDIKIDKVGILLGVRYDEFDVEGTEYARDLHGRLFEDANGDNIADSIDGVEDAVSYNVSVSYNSDYGYIPYITYAESNSLISNQVGGVPASSIESGNFLAESELKEIGLKYASPDGRIYAALAVYEQEKAYLEGQNQAPAEVTSEGIEFEARAIINDNWSITATATKIETKEVSDLALAVLNTADFAIQNGANPEDYLAGRFAGDRATFLGTGAEVDRGGLPDKTVSVYANYVQDLMGGKLTGSLGFSWADSTYTDIFETIELPSYSVWTGSIGWVSDKYEALFTVNNLFDEEYYTSADLFDSVVVKPSEGRTFTASVNVKF